MEGEPCEILPTPSVGDPERVEFSVTGESGPLILRGHRWRGAAALGPRPALVEFNPYRCRDGMLYVDSLMYPFFAERGYDCYRIDLPGSGDSSGHLRDEYTAEELSCCRQVIDLIGSNGRVCMMGKSWSAMNALMVAAFDPPAALAAVIFCCGSDDRFDEDVHYRGGAMMADNFSWASTMFGLNFLPPDPDIVPDWQAEWTARAAQADFWLRIWGAPDNQARSAYWSDTAVRDHYDKVKVPVFLLSGWRDGYKNTVMRAVSGLANSPDVRALMGPWGHKYPFNGHPGPRIDWLRPVEAWLHSWLKEPDPMPPRLEGWPQFLVWLGDSAPPSAEPRLTDPGRWVAEDAAWAEREISLYLHPCQDGRLAGAPSSGSVVIDTPRDAGADAMPETSSWGEAGNADLPGDMTAGDAVSAVFDGDPLTEDLDLFGCPRVAFSFTARADRGALCFRLSEIDPMGGGVALLSYGFVNLTQLAGDRTSPSLLVPGRRYAAEIGLDALGHRIKAGWRLRLSVSTNWFPTLWPSTSTASPVTLHLGDGTWLRLPRRQPRSEDAGAKPLIGRYTADAERYCPSETLFPASTTRGVWRGISDSGWYTELRKSFDHGKVRYGGLLNGLVVNLAGGETYRAMVNGEAYYATAHWATCYERGDWWARTETETRIEWLGGWDFAWRASVTLTDGTGLRQVHTRSGRLERRWI